MQEYDIEIYSDMNRKKIRNKKPLGFFFFLNLHLFYHHIINKIWGTKARVFAHLHNHSRTMHFFLVAFFSDKEITSEWHLNIALCDVSRACLSNLLYTPNGILSCQEKIIQISSKPGEYASVHMSKIIGHNSVNQYARP